MPLNSKALAWIILLSLVLVWGSSFILIKRGLEIFSFQEVGALRISIAFLFLLPFAASRFRYLNRKNTLYLILVGIIGNGLPAFLFARAQTGIDSNLAGILNSLTPLFTLLISVFFFRFKTGWLNVAGIFIALAGAVGLTGISGGHNLTFNVQYAVYILIATMCYATSVNLIKFKLSKEDVITITSFSFFFTGIPVMIYLFAGTPFLEQVSGNPRFLSGLGYIAILGIAGTALAMFAFNRLVKITTPVFASSVTYMIPIMAVIWGILDGEKFEAQYILWIALILGGVYLVNRKFKTKNT
ncbi:MAG: DMT family transporter [Bacteroidetes bacterium]|nr:DMT family transporter [Bacteroidota bacterium]